MLHGNPFETVWAWGPIFGILTYQDKTQPGNFDGKSSLFFLVNAIKIVDFPMLRLFTVEFIFLDLDMWPCGKKGVFESFFFQIKIARRRIPK